MRLTLTLKELKILIPRKTNDSHVNAMHYKAKFLHYYAIMIIFKPRNCFYSKNIK